MTAPTEQPVRTFRFERDTFAFAHELVWQYHFDPVTGAMTTFQLRSAAHLLSSLLRDGALDAAIFLSRPL